MSACARPSRRWLVLLVAPLVGGPACALVVAWSATPGVGDPHSRVAREVLARQATKNVALATKLDRRWSKDEILPAYLNTAYFGQGAYGVAEASGRYFGVSAASLDDVHSPDADRKACDEGTREPTASRVARGLRSEDDAYRPHEELQSKAEQIMFRDHPRFDVKESLEALLASEGKLRPLNPTRRGRVN